ncbi:ABC transporter substrate-binding protein [Hydrogenophaga sp. PAMC20947]|uniref:ABC transporter substrate-binding protein n=1 Tax=Hydrogenophaga sp. PAMC20947 TaxID=2565558 RepID=UPI0014476BE8|nr:ABC transporter substrate-binding protein [Hydrogenophaga sp. PAMC20947]
MVEPRVRIAFIDPLSGPTAGIGRNALRTWQFMARKLGGVDNPAGVSLTVAGFDNKGSPQESLNAMKAAIDQGFRYIVQGNGSGVATAIVEAVERHNLRHPDRAVLYINYAAMDPVLTQEGCSYWHVRIDADTSMKTQALARFLGSQSDLERVYLLNQNHAHGQQASFHFKEALTRLAPRVSVVGEALHPPFQGQDFSPLVQQVQASGAQALVTANGGSDLQELVACMVDKKMETPLYAYYLNHPGVPAVLADARRRFPAYQVACGHTNLPGRVGALAREFRRETGEDLVFYAAYDGVAMLIHAMRFAESTDAARVTARISGMLFKGFNGPVQINPEDHQLQKGVFVSRWQNVNAEYPVAAEETDFTFAPIRYFEAGQLSGNSSCQMRRP